MINSLKEQLFYLRAYYGFATIDEMLDSMDLRIAVVEACLSYNCDYVSLIFSNESRKRCSCCGHHSVTSIFTFS